MNKRKILIGVGAFVVAVGSFFAGKANVKKFLAVNLYYFQGPSGHQTCTPINTTGIFTTTGSASAINFVTSSGASEVVYSNSSCTDVVSVYIKP